MASVAPSGDTRGGRFTCRGGGTGARASAGILMGQPRSGTPSPGFASHACHARATAPGRSDTCPPDARGRGGSGSGLAFLASRQSVRRLTGTAGGPRTRSLRHSIGAASGPDRFASRCRDVKKTLRFVMSNVLSATSRLRSALLLGRIAGLFSSRRVLPSRRLTALGARTALSTDRKG